MGYFVLVLVLVLDPPVLPGLPVLSGLPVAGARGASLYLPEDEQTLVPPAPPPPAAGVDAVSPPRLPPHLLTSSIIRLSRMIKITSSLRVEEGVVGGTEPADLEACEVSSARVCIFSAETCPSHQTTFALPRWRKWMEGSARYLLSSPGLTTQWYGSANEYSIRYFGFLPYGWGKAVSQNMIVREGSLI
jgi:hypothetical protein